MKYYHRGLVLVIVFMAGFMTDHLTEHVLSSSFSKDYVVADSKYTYINPLLFCQDQNLSNQDTNSLEKTVSDYIDAQKQNGTLIDAAFYFRDLNGGPWAIVNKDFRAYPGSLLKLPMALAVYREAAHDSAFLSKQVTTDSFDANANEYFASPKHVSPNTAYSIKSLVTYLLADSDNGALLALSKVVDQGQMQEAYMHLGIQPPQEDNLVYTMNVRTYASFFRLLYGGTYLSEDASEELLSILASSDFDKGIVAGVPASLKIAHKFGESQIGDSARQLHDCGIVYKPKQPYLICIMTQGYNYDMLANVISTISSEVYTALASTDQ